MVDKALSDWGSLITWEEDHNFVARILVKAKVVALQEIPWFIYCSENDDFEGDTWIVQCEVLQTRMLGALPVDEDDPPNDHDDINPNAFDFFGFGQPGNGPVFGPPPDPAVGPHADGWGLWPDQHNPDQEQPPNQHLNLGAAGVGNVLPEEDFLEINDHLQGAGAHFDLNIPLQGDLGELEDNPDLVPAFVEAPVQVIVPQQVIEASSDSSTPSDGPAIALPDLNMEPVEVDIFIPMDEDGFPLQINPDEIQEEQLLGNSMSGNQHNSDESSSGMNMDMDQQVDQAMDQTMHLGFVEVPAPLVDPVFGQRMGQHWDGAFSRKTSALPADFFRFWAKHFDPSNGPSSVCISPDWAAFFASALLNPGSFDWAKSFLSSPAWAFFANASGSDFPFALPTSCPVKETTTCISGNGVHSILVVEDLVAVDLSDEAQLPESDCGFPDVEVDTREISPSNGPWAKSLLINAGKLKLSEDDPALRRSVRRKE